MMDLISKPYGFKQILKGLRLGTYSLSVVYIEGEEMTPGKYYIPVDKELMSELNQHLEIKEKAHSRMGIARRGVVDLSRDSGPIRIRRLINQARRELEVDIELPQDRILYDEIEATEYSTELQRAIEVHDKYWGKGGPGVKSAGLILQLQEEGFNEAAAKRIAKVARPDSMK